MKVASPRPARTAWRFGSVTELSGADDRGQADVVGVQLVADVDAAEELEEVDRLGRRVGPTAIPLPPPTPSVAAPAPPATVGKGNQPRSSPSPFLSALWSIWTDGRPLAHQLHGRLAVADGRRLGVVVGRRVALLVRVEGVELQDLLAGLGAGVGVPVTALDHLRERLAATVRGARGRSTGALTATCPCRRSPAGRCPRP